MAFVLLMPGRSLNLPQSAPLLDLALDTAGHAVLMFGFALLVVRSLGRRVSQPRVWGVAVSALWALLLELLQIPIPGRGWELIDLGSGVVGALAGAALSARWVFAERDPAAPPRL